MEILLKLFPPYTLTSPSLTTLDVFIIAEPSKLKLDGITGNNTSFSLVLNHISIKIHPHNLLHLFLFF